MSAHISTAVSVTAPTERDQQWSRTVRYAGAAALFWLGALWFIGRTWLQRIVDRILRAERATRTRCCGTWSASWAPR